MIARVAMMHEYRTRSKIDRPDIPNELKRPITGFIKVGNIMLHALIDTGCEGEMVSHDAVRLIGKNPSELNEPVPLQLAVAGSRSSIHYGIRVDTLIGGSPIETYFDVVNIDYYDVVLGMPFLKTHRVIIDCAEETAILPDQSNLLITESQAARWQLEQSRAAKLSFPLDNQ
jgi:hypothetical protein